MRKNCKDISGKKFGKLNVIKCFSICGKRGIHCECLCDCGNSKVVYGGHLRKGSTKSCGCLSLDSIEESAKSAIYGRYKAKAKRRKIYFELNRSDFDKLITGNCNYCKCKPKQELKNSTNIHACFYNGIDRYDNSSGYTKENSVSCCKLCNIMKYDLSFEDWIYHMKKVIEKINV